MSEHAWSDVFGMCLGLGMATDDAAVAAQNLIEKTLFACPDCGCTDVQITAWIEPNTQTIVNGESPAEYAFCPQCQNADLRDRDLVETKQLKPYKKED